MARKTKEEAQETYTALLDAAEAVFSEKGVTNTTLNDVATAAGMTRGAIYWHFKDKNALFHAMCDRAFLPMESLLNEIHSTRDNDPKAAIRKMNIHFLQQVASDQRQKKVFDIILHRCEKSADMTFFVLERDKRNECMSRMEALLISAVEQGMLPPETDTWVAMQANHGFLIGLVHEWLVDTEIYDLPHHAESMVDMFLAGLFSCPPLKKKAS